MSAAKTMEATVDKLSWKITYQKTRTRTTNAHRRTDTVVDNARRRNASSGVSCFSMRFRSAWLGMSSPSNAGRTPSVESSALSSHNFRKYSSSRSHKFMAARAQTDTMTPKAGMTLLCTSVWTRNSQARTASSMTTLRIASASSALQKNPLNAKLNATRGPKYSWIVAIGCTNDKSHKCLGPAQAARNLCSHNSLWLLNQSTIRPSALAASRSR
mmetsp:Transcript_27868/g.83999  ORF Transcript_27868/g.83999 Transcript_27868/m.83999 type:complete len:214 (+) Transcript_27868:1072-1713(+)